MILEILKEQVYETNMELPRRGLITYTWGDVSGINRASGPFVIKPGGVDYDGLWPEDMAVMGLEGNRVEGAMNPSSDTATHLGLYQAFLKIGGVVRTHSPSTTSWAQAGRRIPCCGTTHTDYLYGEIPYAGNLTPEETEEGYEKNTGKMIVEIFARKNLVYVSGVLYKSRGPLTWGRDMAQAIYDVVILEETAKMNLTTELLNPNGDNQTPQCMQDKRFLRKHGPNVYYGQGKG